jgi:hypothetical protein
MVEVLAGDGISFSIFSFSRGRIEISKVIVLGHLDTWTRLLHRSIIKSAEWYWWLLRVGVETKVSSNPSSTGGHADGVHALTGNGRLYRVSLKRTLARCSSLIQISVPSL